MNTPRSTGRRPGGFGAFALLALLWCCVAGAQSAAGTLLEQADAAIGHDADLARSLAQRALDEAIGASDSARQAQAYLLLGRIDLLQGKPTAAIVAFERALALPQTSPELRAKLLTYLGATLDRSGLSVDAVAPQQEALALYLDARNWQDASAVLANLGNAYAGQGDTAAARAHYERALALKREHGITRGVGSALNNLADAALGDGRHEEAVTLLQEAIAASSAPGDLGARTTAQTNLAMALAGLGRFDEALAQVERAQAQALALDDTSRQLGVLRARATVLLQRARAAAPGSSARALSLREAAQNVQPAIARARDGEDLVRAVQLTELLSEIREEQGDAAGALALLRDARRQREAIDARAQGERRAAASARFEYAKQSGELAVLRERDAASNDRVRTQRWLLLALGLAGLACVAAALFALRRLRERHRFDQTLQQRNRELAAALDEANAQHRRSDAYAASHRHLLQLASEDLRAPLNDIRADAERLLADPGDADRQHRRIASIARAAADLIWVTDQMLESAREPDFAAPLDPHPNTPLRPLLRDLLDEASVHALRHQQDLALDAPDEVEAAVHPQRLRAVLHELLELVLRASPAHTRCVVRLRRVGDTARILVDDPAGAAAGWQQKMDAPRDGAHVPRLGFAWIAQSIDALGGEIGTTMHGAPPARAIAILLPCVPGAASTPVTAPATEPWDPALTP
ncbi:tetratricopeptide repeat protein [Chiayiivirga flava]|uniref:Signal transduction histidine kinase n=1 Tax=Chiayiivirga flava TaxID=659595 RepID=A0A7W8G070_9GAMM|nr:signal transduction histidine kinase [Chiayiivirga flava]